MYVIHSCNTIQYWNKVISTFQKITPISPNDSWEEIAIKLYICCGSSIIVSQIMKFNNIKIPGKKIVEKDPFAEDVIYAIMNYSDMDNDLIRLARSIYQKELYISD